MKGNKLAPYVPSKGFVVKKMLEMAEASRNDVLFDLGSGVGNVVAYSLLKPFQVKHAVGIEMHEGRARKSKYNLRQLQIEYPYIRNRWDIINEDIFNCDISEATIVTAYLTPRGNEKIRRKLENELGKARVVTNSFKMPEWKPSIKDVAIGKPLFYKRPYPVYLYDMSKIR